VSDPTPEEARRLTAETLGVEAIGARRFTTGLHHFVYEVELADGRMVAMRMTRPSEAGYMRSAVALSRQLRPLRVPLPELLAADVAAPFPWMLLARLPGRDLGEVVADLSPSQQKAIAEQVVAAQQIAALTPTAGRYGFSATPEEAPFARWSDVIAAHIERSRSRIASAGLFDLAVIDPLMRKLSGFRGDLDAIAATPFLHDTTTKNVIVSDDGSFAGIVDVDDLCYGDPRFVPALTHVALRDVPVDYADYLMQAAGWADDRAYRLYIAVILLDFMSEHGQRFNDNEPTSSPEARQRLFAHYERALAAL
jgi:aminoglycoside phosphotransferase (APT) family kinase protein